MVEGRPRRPSPYLLGLTGGIGSGKSAVADMLASQGAAIIDADVVSRELCGPGSPLLAALADAFGAEVVAPDGTLDRPLLSSRVFGNPEAVARLNELTHPPIMAEMQRRAAGASAPVVVLVVPLLVEAGAARMMDEIWVVEAPLEVRLQRVAARDGVSEQQARARMAAQAGDAERRAVADLVIDNAGDREATRAQVLAAWQKVRARVPR
jgi:dephospho-CoA kinase